MLRPHFSVVLLVRIYFVNDAEAPKLDEYHIYSKCGTRAQVCVHNPNIYEIS